MNLSDFFLVNDWLMNFVDYRLMMFMNDVLVMLMNHILMMFMNYISVMLFYNWLISVHIDSGSLLMSFD